MSELPNICLFSILVELLNICLFTILVELLNKCLFTILNRVTLLIYCIDMNYSYICWCACRIKSGQSKIQSTIFFFFYFWRESYTPPPFRTLHYKIPLSKDWLKNVSVKEIMSVWKGIVNFLYLCLFSMSEERYGMILCSTLDAFFPTEPGHSWLWIASEERLRWILIWSIYQRDLIATQEQDKRKCGW